MGFSCARGPAVTLYSVAADTAAHVCSSNTNGERAVCVHLSASQGSTSCRMRRCQLQLNALCGPTLRSAFVNSVYCDKTNCTHTNMVFRVCLCGTQA